MCGSLAELFAGLSCSHQTARHLSPTPTVARNLTCEITTAALERVWSKLVEGLHEAPRVNPCVVRNLKVVTVHQILSGLQPLLGAGTTGIGLGGMASGGSKGADGVDPTKVFG